MQGASVKAARTFSKRRRFWKRNNFPWRAFDYREQQLLRKLRGAAMNKDNIEGAGRQILGQGEEMAGRLLKDKQTTAQGIYDDAVGKAQSAYGNVKDAVANGADAAGVDLAGLRDDIARLTQTVNQLVQAGAANARGRVMDAVGAAGDNISQSASAAQDKLVSLEADVESKIQKNPWGAVAIAAMVGLLIGKLS